jgi:hypothetical protein
MMAETIKWERHPCGAYICIPIDPRNLDEAREWCNENCQGDFLIILGRRIFFQFREDAALATAWWRAGEAD